MGNFLSPLKSRAKNVSTFLSTQKSALTLKSPSLSASTLTSALLGTSGRALGPPQATSTHQAGRTPPRGVARLHGGQRSISLEYQIYLPSIGTLLTVMILAALVLAVL